MEPKITILYCFFMLFSTTIIVESDTVKNREITYKKIKYENLKIDEKLVYLNKEIKIMEDSLSKIKITKNVPSSTK